MADILSNPKARRDYHILETFEAGIVLRGTEVKALRAGKGQISDAFARVEDGEVHLYNAHIDELSQAARQSPALNKELDRWTAERDRLMQATGGEPQPIGATLQAKRGEANAGYNETARQQGELAREARIRSALQGEQVTDAMPREIRPEWVKQNKRFEMGKAGEQASITGSVQSEVQNPRQELRDLSRVLIATQGEEAAVAGLRQLVLSKLAGMFGNDVRRRVSVARSARAEAGKPALTANAARYLGPGTTAEVVRREIERQRAARENPR